MLMKFPSKISTASLLLVVMCAFVTVWAETKLAYDQNSDTDTHYEWVAQEDEDHMPTDAMRIMSGIDTRPNFSQVWGYWVGPWSMGPSQAYYRPLTSTLWWLMNKAFGRNGLVPFLMILAFSHLCVVVLLWALLRYLTRDNVFAVIGSCLWTLGAAHWLFRLATPAYALQMWIDDPEMWLSLCFIGACFSFVKYLRDGRRKWLWASLACFVLGITVKEAIYSLPIMILVLLWLEKRLASWKLVLPYIAIATAGLAYRFWALHGLGYKFGSNGSWLSRAVMELGGGSVLAALFRSDYLPLMLGAAAAALAIGLLWKMRSAAIVLGLIAVFCAYKASVANSGMDDPFYLQLLGSPLPWVLGITAMLWFIVLCYIARLVYSREPFARWIIFGWLWAVVTYLPLLAAPTTLHTLYIVSIGYGIMIAALVSSLVSQYSQRLGRNSTDVLCAPAYDAPRWNGSGADGENAPLSRA